MKLRTHPRDGTMILYRVYMPRYDATHNTRARDTLDAASIGVVIVASVPLALRHHCLRCSFALGWWARMRARLRNSTLNSMSLIFTHSKNSNWIQKSPATQSIVQKRSRSLEFFTITTQTGFTHFLFSKRVPKNSKQKTSCWTFWVTTPTHHTEPETSHTMVQYINIYIYTYMDV